MSGRKRAFRVSGRALVLDGRKQSGYGLLSITGITGVPTSPPPAGTGVSSPFIEREHAADF
jgi:hypothetical protein